MLCLGDSITQAWGRNSFRRLLSQKLVSGGYSFDFVGSLNRDADCTDFPDSDFDPDHEGHWGWRVDEVLIGKTSGCYGTGKLEDWLVFYDPDIAFIHLGSNDMFQSNTISSTVTELETVIDILRADNPHTVIFLAQLIPTTLASNTAITNLNMEIPGIATRKSTSQSPIIIVDQNTGFDPVTDTYDAIHPNGSGEAKMAQKWFDAFDNYCKKQVPAAHYFASFILILILSIRMVITP